jgi:hypothetical protein
MRCAKRGAEESAAHRQTKDPVADQVTTAMRGVARRAAHRWQNAWVLAEELNSAAIARLTPRREITAGHS